MMEKVKLGDVCEIQSGGTPSRTNPDFWNNGTIPWVKISDFNGKYLNKTQEFITQKGLENSSAKMFEKGTILYTIFATLGETCILDIQATTNQAIAGIKIIDNRIEKDYLYNFLVSKKSYVNEIGRGVAQNNINLKILKSFEIPVLSIQQQKQISEELEKVTDLINKRKEQLLKLDELVKARFVELFGDLMLNPYEWPVVRISDVSLLLKSGLSRKLSDDDIGLPVIRSGNIQNGQFIYGDVKYWYKDDPQGSKTEDYILEDGDILVNFINSASQIGKTAIFRDVGRDCIYTTNIFRMKLSENCNEYYYNWFAMSDYYYRQLQNIIQPAVNQASFTTVNFLKLNIPLPPMELQEQFATFVEQTDKSKLEVQKSLEKLELLKKALMQKYFG